MAYKFATKDEALTWMTTRYQEQCQLFPRTASIPLSLYLRRNLRWAMKMTTDD